MLHYIAPKESVSPCGKTPQLSTVNPELVECVVCIEKLAKQGLLNAETQYERVFGPKGK